MPLPRMSKKLRDPKTETGSLSNHGQRFLSKLNIDGRFIYGLENGDFRQVHEGNMAKQLEALGSKMVITFRRPLLLPPIRKWQFVTH